MTHDAALIIAAQKGGALRNGYLWQAGAACCLLGVHGSKGDTGYRLVEIA